jgi:hypothetical protein
MSENLASESRDPWHINELIDALRGAWVKNPEQRLAQLVTNAALASGANDAFYCEDDALLQALRAQN